MKKKNSDSQKASELLQKLQEAVLSSSHKKESRQETPDSDELEFQKKIAGMLSRVTEGKASDSKPRKSRKKNPKKAITPAPEVSHEPEPIPVDDTVENEIPLPLPEEPVREEVGELSPPIVEPMIEEIETVEEIEETVSQIEEPFIEESSVEESSVEESPTEEFPESQEEPESPIIEPISYGDITPITDEREIEDTPIFVAQEHRDRPIESVDSGQEPLKKEEVPPPPPEPRKPLVRVIPAVPTEERRKETPSDTIVIKPKSDLRSTTPIVIKPQKQPRSTEPIRVEGNISMPRTTQKINPSQKQESSTPQRKPTTKASASSGVSIPRSADAKKAPAHKGKSPHKHPQRPAPAAHSLPSDEGLDVVLENVAQDEAFLNVTMTDDTPLAAGRPRSNVHALTHEELLRYVERKTGMTPDDVSMILELGYDHELGRLIGSEPLKQLKTAHAHAARPSDPTTYRTALGYRNREYTGEESRERVLSNYVRDKKRLIVRLVITVLLTLLLLPIELPTLFGEPFLGIRERIPQLFPLVALLILAVAGFFSSRQILAGLQSFFRFAPTPYSVSAILYPIGLLSEVANVFLVGRGIAIVSAALPALGALLVTAVSDAARLSCEMRVLGILADASDKTVLEPAQSHKQKLRHGDKIVKIVNDDVDQNLYRLHRAKRISGFFRRCNDTSSAARPFGFLLLATVTLTFFVGFFCTVWRMKAQTVASAALLTILFSLPIPAVLLFFYPLCRANRLLTARRCALIGEESVIEYAKQKTVIFHDSDMYHVRKCTQTMVREGEDFRRDLQLASILFRKMNGALNPLSETKASDPPVTFVRLGESGTEAVIDSRHHLLAGNAKFLAKSGVRIPKESTDREVGRAENVSVTYIAIDGVLKLTYEIEYEISPKFEQTVAILAENCTDCAIRTYDPSLNDAFLQEGRPQDAEYVRVIKPGKYESDDASEISDCGAVALGDHFDAVQPLVAATTICRIRSYGYYTQLVLAIVGAAVATLLSFRMTELLPGVPMLLALAFQGLGIAAAWIATRLAFRFGSAQNFK